jgi:ADP-ribose pyrophosphatase YjhB (NUDIX family)
MADTKRSDNKDIRRDQQVRREVLDEIGAEVTQERTTAQYRNPNRDQARGDWDRSGRHTDEEA